LSSPSIVALIPARAGSERVPKKNVRLLGSHPLLAYSIASAQESGIFSRIVCSTDSEDIAAVAEHYGASIKMRPEQYATSTSPDIEWIRNVMAKVKWWGEENDAFAILRPTSPFRTAEMIRCGWKMLQDDSEADSIRAVEKCSQHPYKMWTLTNDGLSKDNRLKPLHPAPKGEHPWHSTQYQWLPEIYVQNTSLEIAWTRVLEGDQAQAGNVIMPFFTQGNEGLVIDYERDFRIAEEIAALGGKLPEVKQAPYEQAKMAKAI
jgi:CMP-N,N'-diacetyllegionaminic acid synthase